MVGSFFSFIGRNSPPPPPGVGAPVQWGNPSIIAEHLAASFETPFFARGRMEVPALSVEHFRLFLEKSVGPMQKLVESLAADPAKLSAIRSGLIALVTPYYEDNVVHQDYLLTRARTR